MRTQVFRSLFWQGGATVIARGLRYLAVLGLARILEPAAFGQFASIYVFVDGLHLIQGFGIAQAIIVRRERQELGADTAFWLSIGIAVLLGLGALAAAPLIGSFYRDPGLVRPFLALVGVLPIHAVRVVPLRLFEREMDFRAKVVPTVAAGLSYCVVALLAAWAGWGIWSFVAAVLVSAVVESAAFWISSPWRPRVRFSTEIAREDLAFGVPIMLAGVLTYLYNSMDRAFLGRFAGAIGLGPYAFAYSLASLPVTLGSMVTSLVMIPSYAALADRPDKRGDVLVRATRLTFGFAVGVATVLVVWGDHGLRAAYGDRWLAAGGPLAILSLTAVFRASVVVVGDALVGSGASASYRRINAVQLVGAAILLPIGWSVSGVAGVAWAMTAGSALALAEAWRTARRMLGTDLRSLVGAAVRPIVIGIALVSLGTYGRSWVAAAPAPVLFAAASTGLFFVLGWLSWDRSAREDVRSVGARRR